MRFGVYGEMKKYAMSVPSHALEAIGLRGDEQAWGMWVRPRGGYDDPGDPEQPTAVGRHLPHLIVSRAHPDTWPTCVRIEAKLANKHGTAARLLKELDSHGINLLGANIVPTGYNYGIFSGFGHFVDIDPSWRDRFTTAYRTAENLDDARERTTRAIGMDLLNRIASVRTSILLANTRDTEPFLSSRIVRGGYEPWHLDYGTLHELINDRRASDPAIAEFYREALGSKAERFARDYLRTVLKTRSPRFEYKAYSAEIVNLWQQQWEEPLVISVPTILSHLRLWSWTEKEGTPETSRVMRFTCRNISSQLHIIPDDPDEFVFPEEGCSLGGPPADSCRRLTAAVHVRNQFVRFRFFRDGFVAKFTKRIVVPYESRLEHTAAPGPVPKGLLGGLMDAISKIGPNINIEWVNNTLLESGPRFERGEIEIVCRFEDLSPDAMEMLLTQRIQHGIAEFNEMSSDIEVVIRPRIRVLSW